MKPFFNKEPLDVVALVGQRVLFECSVGGEPSPHVLWRREDGKMPIGRAQILDDKSLRIDNVQPADEGLYICDADNLVGSVTARATLVVNCKSILRSIREHNESYVNIQALHVMRITIVKY